MKDTIREFMWGYQRHVRVSLNESAKTLFQKLDGRLAPEVFFVGILQDAREDRLPVCVEPEDDFWVSSVDFDGLDQSSQALLTAYPESRLHHSHPLSDALHNDGLRARSFRDAILAVLMKCETRMPGRQHFASFPVLVDGFAVFIVLGLDRSMVDSYAALTSRSYKLHEYREIPIQASLLEATAQEFLEFAMSALREPSNPFPPMKDPDALLRNAGGALARGIAPRVNPQNHWGHALFAAFNTIAALRYEGAVGAGGLVLARSGHPSVQPAVTFKNPIPLQQFRSVRKLLELSFDDFVLITDGSTVGGLARLATTAGDPEDLFEVRIQGHHHWELRCRGRTLMVVRYGLPELPKQPFDEAKLRSDLSRLFPAIAATELDRLAVLVRQAERESHGTTLVISEAAAEEAQRLASQATVIAPCVLTAELLTHLTPIDGAILLDPAGVCHAIGVILDGVATPNGDPGRGARFNSAIRYVESQLQQTNCFAIVVSEDRGVDFVPFLRPAIRRSDIDAAIEELRRQRAGSLKHSRYRRELDWLDENRFYLREADCQELNTLVQQLEELFETESPSNIRVIRKPFAAAEAMDEAFYYLAEGDAD